LSDAELSVARAYGVMNESGQGCKRSVFVVDRDGVLRLVNRAYAVNEDAQYQAVFEALKAIP